MKRLAIVFLAAGLLAGACAPYYAGPPAPGSGFVVAVQDRPYYIRGPYYFDGGRRWVWVGGHWGHRHGHRVWVHGHYVNRG